MNILIVDDEPIFIKKVRRIITEFDAETGETTEVAEAYSGQEALKIIAKSKPDLLFTDIKMSNMNGIELSLSLQKDFPEIPIVIISGYPSFDYARAAIRANVLEYLLKPIDPELVKAVIHRVYPRLLEAKYAEEKQLLQRAIEFDDQWEEKRVDGNDAIRRYRAYYVVAIQNLEVMNDRERLFYRQTDIAHEAYMTELNRHIGENGSAWIFDYRDQRSYMIIVGLKDEDEEAIEGVVDSIVRYFSFRDFPVSVVYTSGLHKISNIKETIPLLADVLKDRIVLGVPSRIRLKPGEAYSRIAYMQLGEQEEMKMSSLLQKEDTAAMKKQFFLTFQMWKAERLPVVEVEQNMKRLYGWVEKHARFANSKAAGIAEKRIEEILQTAVSFEEAAEFLWELLLERLEPQAGSRAFEPPAPLFKQIDYYLKTNLNRPIGLNHLSEHFKVSRTYLCNLFRKQAGASFLDYFNTLRMDKAKELIRERPELMFKEIAERIGFWDHHYFSRVFKTFTGLTPSEFRQAESISD
ncbi:response regulator [Cohnella silvisoli]|uniref:Response regulator n=1 Tax=Cohnella silvisoli TaxID=2873699 RepID=A0ABV1KW19_9BACL|nr:response regulator [Cohnella silvisoli]MCD9023148.1 response regulator [Cohnella silvisoli]